MDYDGLQFPRCFKSIRRRLHGKTLAAQRRFERRQNLNVVIHYKQAVQLKTSVSRAKEMWKVVPSDVEFTWIAPPWLSTIRLTIGNPSPQPFGAAENIGSKMRLSASAGIPAPVSA